MKFVKYQAIGNDFIITQDNDITPEKAEMLCDRHFGIGADGVLVHYKSDKADAGMKIFNSDGTFAEMCGNGLRCFTVYLVNDCGYSKNPIAVETGRGILHVNWEKLSDGKIVVEANLGAPEIISEFKEVDLAEMKLQTVSISMGNPHCVVFAGNMPVSKEIYKITSHFQHNSGSGYEMNVEVVSRINEKAKSVFIVVRERGAGFTLGCGTGGAAVIYALKLKGVFCATDTWKVFFPGGEAEYRIENSGEIIMRGVPEKVFSGVFNE